MSTSMDSVQAVTADIATMCIEMCSYKM